MAADLGRNEDRPYEPPGYLRGAGDCTISEGEARGQSERWPTLVIDPPWEQNGGPSFHGRQYDSRAGAVVSRRGGGPSRPLPYPTMTLEEIAALPVAEVTAADAHLYLWVTNRYIEAGYGLVRGWGFTPSTLLTWGKPPGGLGMGGAFVQTSEHILFARRGRDVRQERSRSTWWEWKRPYRSDGKPDHSRKPDAFYDVVEQVSPGPYAELFARRARLGWDYPIGDQALGGVAA